MRLLTKAVQRAEERRAGERALELAFLGRLRREPERMGLQSGLDVHAARRLEAELACERLSLLLDEATAGGATPGRRPQIFAPPISNRNP